MASDDDGMETTFACTDCGIQAWSWGIGVCWLPPRCGVCAMLARIEGEAVMERLEAAVERVLD